MRRSFCGCLLFGGISLGVATPAFAQSASECRQQTDPSLRLACYDRFYPVETFQSGEAANSPNFSFSWTGVSPCKSITNGPAFKFVNIPKAAKRVLLVLDQGNREFGGQEVPLPSDGVLPEGAIKIVAPCVPGRYRWTATLKSSGGEALALIRKDSQFPGD